LSFARGRSVTTAMTGSGVDACEFGARTMLSSPAMSSESYHEPLELLSEETRNLHRAIVSLCEELEAVDWYHQRAEACSDPDLRAVITHNEHEEVEHAMMNLEWIRRHNPVFAANIGKYIQSSGSILAVEAGSGGDSGGVASSGGSAGTGVGLGIGSLRGNK
jgi:ferritin-like protein